MSLYKSCINSIPLIHLHINITVLHHVTPVQLSFRVSPLRRWLPSAAVRWGWAGPALLAPADTRPAEDTRFHIHFTVCTAARLQNGSFHCSRSYLSLCVVKNTSLFSPWLLVVTSVMGKACCWVSSLRLTTNSTSEVRSRQPACSWPDPLTMVTSRAMWSSGRPRDWSIFLWSESRASREGWTLETTYNIYSMLHYLFRGTCSF